MLRVRVCFHVLALCQSLLISIWSKTVLICLILRFLWMHMYEFRFERTPEYRRLEFIRWCIYNLNVQQGTEHLLFSVLCFVDHASRFSSCKLQTLRTILFSYIFIPILYMFRAPLCSSSGESIVLIQHLVYVALCRWLSSVQVWMEHSSIQICTLDVHQIVDIYQMSF